jgi:hypothetical protein
MIVFPSQQPQAICKSQESITWSLRIHNREPRARACAVSPSSSSSCPSPLPLQPPARVLVRLFDGVAMSLSVVAPPQEVSAGELQYSERACRGRQLGPRQPWRVFPFISEGNPNPISNGEANPSDTQRYSSIPFHSHSKEIRCQHRARTHACSRESNTNAARPAVVKRCKFCEQRQSVLEHSSSVYDCAFEASRTLCISETFVQSPSNPHPCSRPPPVAS